MKKCGSKAEKQSKIVLLENEQLITDPMCVAEITSATQLQVTVLK